MPSDAPPPDAPDAPHAPDDAVTTTPVSKTAHWHPVARFALLNGGLLLYGVALSAMIRADVGLAPWDALHVGLAGRVPALSIGAASVGVGLLLQTAAWLCFRVPVGLGSALNMVLIGVYIDLFRPRLPRPDAPAAAWAMFLGGVLLVGLATGTYIASGFGAGPRDSFVIGLQRRTGWPVKYVRSGMELLVLASGWTLGAHVGWGTLAFALLIGPAMSVGMGLYGLKR